MMKTWDIDAWPPSPRCHRPKGTRRSRHGRRNPLPAILDLATVVMLSGERSLYAIAQWGHLQPPAVVVGLGNVYGNALAESFFATLKREEVYLHDYRTFVEAETNLERFLDDVYNHKRLHSSLGYRSPSEFEACGDDERFLE